MAKGGKRVRMKGAFRQEEVEARELCIQRELMHSDAAVPHADTYGVGSALSDQADLRRQLEDRNANIAERFHELATLTKLLVERDSGLKSLREQINDLENRVADLTGELSQAHERHRLLVQIYEAHILDTSGRLGRSISRPLRRLANLTGRKRVRIRRLIERSDLFDRQWYLRTYPDVATANMDPLDHYLYYGAQEGRDPSPIFSSNGYAAHNPDVMDAGVNPLVHFVLYGCFERRHW